MRILLSLNKERGTTIILVTHAPDIAAHAQRTIRIRDGKIADAPPSEKEWKDAMIRATDPTEVVP